MKVDKSNIYSQQPQSQQSQIVVPVRKLVDLRPRKSWCFFLSPKAEENWHSSWKAGRRYSLTQIFFSSGLQLIGCHPATLGGQSALSGLLIQCSPHWETPSQTHPEWCLTKHLGFLVQSSWHIKLTIVYTESEFWVGTSSLFWPFPGDSDCIPEWVSFLTTQICAWSHGKCLLRTHNLVGWVIDPGK